MPIANHLERNRPAARAQRVRTSTVGAAHGPAVLVEEREVRGERAEQREQDAELERHQRE